MSEVEREAALVAAVRASPRLMEVLEGARGLALPNWRVISGAIYQTVWNALTGRAPDHGIKDYDLGYFDPDVSWDAEDAVIHRAAAVFPPPLGALVEVRNQARVHLWFPQKFGAPYPPLASTDAALARFICPAFAVGVRLEADDRISVAAPFGLENVFALRLRRNLARTVLDAAFAGVTASALSRWPELTIQET